jgi:hypothetical protein
MSSSISFKSPSQPIELTIPEKRSKLENLQTDVKRKDIIIKIMGLAILGLSGLCIGDVMYNLSLKESYKELETKFQFCRMMAIFSLEISRNNNECNANELEIFQDYYGIEEAAHFCKTMRH